MPGMPYHLEKGPWLSILEDYLNADSARLIDALAQFRASRDHSTSLGVSPFFDSDSFDGDPDYQTPDARRGHMQNDWFGSTTGDAPDFVADVVREAGVDDALGDELSAGVDVSTATGVLDFAQRILDDERVPLDAWPSTGFWFQYHGNVEGIIRESLIRGIEIALGLEHDAEVPEDGPERVLPIELFWKCPQRWFEGWITWRWDRTHRTGQVMIMFATPGSGKPVLQSPGLGQNALLEPSSIVDEDRPAPIGPGPSEPDRNAFQSPKGMWVVSQTDHVQLPATPDERGSTAGDWIIPPFGPSYVGAGPVICVQPAEEDGGVRPFGRTWNPPSNEETSIDQSEVTAS